MDITNKTHKQRAHELSAELKRILSKNYGIGCISVDAKNIILLIDIIFKNWVREKLIENRECEENVRNSNARTSLFGSSLFGMCSDKTDLDIICLAPETINYDDFFQSFIKELQKIDGIQECRKIENAFVPIIKMNINNVDVDLLFAAFPGFVVPDDEAILQEKCCGKMDKVSVRSLNGLQNSMKIMEMISKNNKNSKFQWALSTIKIWAKGQYFVVVLFHLNYI